MLTGPAPHIWQIYLVNILRFSPRNFFLQNWINEIKKYESHV